MEKDNFEDSIKKLLEQSNFAVDGDNFNLANKSKKLICKMFDQYLSNLKNEQKMIQSVYKKYSDGNMLEPVTDLVKLYDGLIHDVSQRKETLEAHLISTFKHYN